MATPALNGLIGGWFIVTSPALIWEQHPSLCVISVVSLVLTACVCVHSTYAPGDGRRLQVAFVASLAAVTGSDCLFSYLAGEETSWQARGVLMLHPRLDLHTPLMYCFFTYCGYAGASRIFRCAQRAPFAEAGAAGLLSAILYIPYMYCAITFLWTTWHDDDAIVRYRIIGIPSGSICWMLCFSACFTGIFRLSEVRRWSPVLAILATCGSGFPAVLMIFLAQLVTGDIISTLTGDPAGFPGRATLGCIIFTEFVPVWSGLRRAGYITTGVRDVLGAIFNWVWEKIWPPEPNRRPRRRNRQPDLSDEVPVLDVGCLVLTHRPISSRYEKEVRAGTKGTVVKIYEDGDALIKFEGSGQLVCKKVDFNRLRVEKKVCPRCSGTGSGTLWSCKLCRGTGKLDVAGRMPHDPIIFRMGLVGYLVTLVVLMARASPEAQLSTGIHQEWGSCDIVDLGVMRRPRRRHVCSEQYQREHLSIDCPGGIRPVDGSQWYTVCGVPHDTAEHTRSSRKVGVVSMTGVFAIVFYLVALAAQGPASAQQ